MKKATRLFIVISVVLLISVSLLSCTERQDEFSVEIIKAHSSSSDDTHLIIDYQNRVFNITYNEEIISKDEIFDLISDYYYGERQMLEAIKSKLGNAATPMVDRFNQSIELNLNLLSEQEKTTNYADPNSMRLHIFGVDGLSSLYHELTHVLWGRTMISYLSEGNAMYWPTFIDLQYYYPRSMERFYLMLGDELDDVYQEKIEQVTAKERISLESAYKLITACRDSYSSKKDLPSFVEELDYNNFVNSLGSACVLNHDLIPRIKESNIITSTVEHKKITENNIAAEPEGFNYYEAYAFYKYLIECHGADAVLEFYDGNGAKSFESIFGAKYEELFPAFVSWIEAN